MRSLGGAEQKRLDGPALSTEDEVNEGGTKSQPSISRLCSSFLYEAGMSVRECKLTMAIPALELIEKRA